MAPAQGGEGSGEVQARRRRRGRWTARLREDEEKRSTGTPTTPPPAPSHEARPVTRDSDDDRSAEVHAWVAKQVREMVAKDAELKRQTKEFRGKRIRVCSGFVMRWNDGTDKYRILTSATLVRSLNEDNNLLPDVMVKVLLPSGNITDGHIFLVDFHYNIAVVEVAPNVKLVNIGTVKEITNRGEVLALGRAYEGGNFMCSRGRIICQSSTFGCSDLLVSSCKITLAGTGGPLINYNGHVLGINFYEENQTSYLSIAMISRVLEHHRSFGKIMQPWLGIRYSALDTVPLGILEHIYQKFPDVEKGLYISNVAKGSPADVAGLCVGDVLVKCGGEVLSTSPEFGAMLLDTCKEHVETHGGDYAAQNITVKVVIKQRSDGSTVLKCIAADVLEKFHYNRWPAPMPCYKARWINFRPL